MMNTGHQSAGKLCEQDSVPPPHGKVQQCSRGFARIERPAGRAAFPRYPDAGTERHGISRILEADTRIIFTTAFEQYALDSYKVNALDYLLKPISYPDFLKAANKALQWYEHMQAPAAEIESIFIKTEYKQVQVELRKILYIEGLKDYVKIFIEDEPHPILSLMSMKSLEEMLPASRFIRVHRSFIVQPEKIKVIERNRIVFGKEYIPISDNYKPRLVEFLAQRSLNFN